MIVGSLRSTRITRLQRYYGLIRPCATHRDSCSSWVFHLGISLGIVTTGSHVPRESLNRAHATFTPVTTQGRKQVPPRAASQANDWSLVSMTFLRFRHLIGGSLAFVFSAHI